MVIFDGSIWDRAKRDAGPDADQYQVLMAAKVGGDYVEEPLDPGWEISLRDVSVKYQRILRWARAFYRSRAGDIIPLAEIRADAFKANMGGKTTISMALRKAWRAKQVTRFYRGLYGLAVSNARNWSGQGRVHGVAYILYYQED